MRNLVFHIAGHFSEGGCLIVGDEDWVPAELQLSARFLGDAALQAPSEELDIIAWPPMDSHAISWSFGAQGKDASGRGPAIGKAIEHSAQSFGVAEALLFDGHGRVARVDSDEPFDERAGQLKRLERRKCQRDVFDQGSLL